MLTVLTPKEVAHVICNTGLSFHEKTTLKIHGVGENVKITAPSVINSPVIQYNTDIG